MAKEIKLGLDFSEIERDFMKIEAIQKKYGQSGEPSSNSAAYTQKERFNTVSKSLEDNYNKAVQNISRQQKAEERTVKSNPFLSAAEREKQLSSIAEKHGGTKDKLAGDYDKVSENIKNLGKNIQASDAARKVEARVWEGLTKEEIAAKKQEILALREKSLGAGGATGDMDAALAKLDRIESKKVKEESGDKNKDKQDNEATLKRVVAAVALDKALHIGASAIGDTTSQLVNVGTTAMAAGPTGMIQTGIIGLAGMFLQAGVKMEKVNDQLSRVGTFNGRNGGQQEFFGSSNKFEELGYDITEVRQEALRTAKSRGFQNENSGDFENDVLSNIRLKQGLGLEDSQLQGLEKYKRSGSSTGNSEDDVLKLIDVLEKNGIATERDLSAMPKYLEKLVTLNQMQFDRTGEVNEDKSLQNLKAFTGVGGIFKNEENAMKVSQGLSNTFQAPKSEYQRYNNIQAVLKAHPELRGNQQGIAEALENAQNDPKILKARIDEALERSKGMSDYNRNLLVGNIVGFGDSATKSRKFTEAYIKSGGKSFDGILNKTGINLNDKAKLGTGTLAPIEARTQNFFNKDGQKAVDGLKSITETVLGVDLTIKRIFTPEDQKKNTANLEKIALGIEQLNNNNQPKMPIKINKINSARDKRAEDMLLNY